MPCRRHRLAQPSPTRNPLDCAGWLVLSQCLASLGRVGAPRLSLSGHQLPFTENRCDGYLTVDTMRLPADDLRRDNAAALLAGLCNPTLEHVPAQAAALRARLNAPELRPLLETVLGCWRQCWAAGDSAGLLETVLGCWRQCWAAGDSAGLLETVLGCWRQCWAAGDSAGLLETVLGCWRQCWAAGDSAGLLETVLGCWRQCWAAGDSAGLLETVLGCWRQCWAAGDSAGLLETVLGWVQHVAERDLGFDLGIDDMAEVDRLHESGELEEFFATRRRAYQDRYRAEGVARGIEQGLAAERELLRRQAARKFGAGTAGRLAGLLAGVGDADQLAQAGDWIIDCATGEELIARFGNGSPRGS